MFKVHITFMQSMQQLSEVKNVTSACSMPGMLDQFNDMDAKLEKIQKSLENYLESKRQQFPRFYFLSSDDLLEILGQAKDPMNVQSHLKKCFEGDFVTVQPTATSTVYSYPTFICIPNLQIQTPLKETNKQSRQQKPITTPTCFCRLSSQNVHPLNC